MKDKLFIEKFTHTCRIEHSKNRLTTDILAEKAKRVCNLWLFMVIDY